MKNAKGLLFVAPFFMLLAAIFINTAQPGFPGFTYIGALRGVVTENLEMASASGVTALGGKVKLALDSQSSQNTVNVSSGSGSGNANVSVTQSNVGGDTTNQTSTNTANLTVGQNATVNQSTNQETGAATAVQNADNDSTIAAGNNVDTNQSNQQVISVGGSTPGTIVLGDNGAPSTVIVGGSTGQTAVNTSTVTAGNDASTNQSNAQGVVIGDTSAPVQLGSVAQSGSNISDAAAGNNLDTSQSNNQNVAAGSQPQPDTAIIGSVAQTASNDSGSTAGNDSSTSQSNNQNVAAGSQPQPATVYIGSVVQKTANTAESTANNANTTSQANVQTSNGGSNTQTSSNSNTASGSQVGSTQQTVQAVGNTSTVTTSTLGTLNNSSVYPVDSAAQVILQKSGARYVAQLKSVSAQSVEFYAQKIGVAVSFYLGSASLSDGLWQYSFNSSAYPNGNYSLYAQIVEKGGTFQSAPIVFSIGNNTASNSEQQTIITQVSDTKQQLTSIYQQIDQTAVDAAKDIADGAALDKKDANTVESSISDLVKTIQVIEQLKDLLKQKTAERNAVNDEIARLQAQLQNLPSDTLESTRNDLIAQIREAQLRKQSLDDQIAIIQEAIEQKQNEKNTLAISILELTKSLEGKDISGTLATVENSVVQDQQNAIELLHKLTRDTDGDGLNDYEEIYVYHTGANNPDTDGDGFLDGDEVAHGYNPLDPGSASGKSGQLTYQDPRKVSPRQTDLFRIESVQSAKLANGSSGIKLTGKGLPNSFVTIYIYSQPLVVFVKTDSHGRWEYTLDKALDDGLHTVYAAETDSQGLVQARSLEYVFIKSGNSMTRTTSSGEASMASTIQQLESDFGFYTIFTIVLAMSIALLIIGFVGRLGAARLDG